MCAEPTRELVEQYHSLYIGRLRALYYKHRGEHHAYKDKELKIW